MSSPLPDLLDPWRAVESRSVFTGRLPMSSMSRLRGLLLDAAGDVAFRLAFLRDEEQRGLIHCEVAAILRLRCQRCLEGLDRRVDANNRLALVTGADEERQLPERYDPLPVMERLIRPRELIEDELLLALPQIAMHDPDECGAHGSQAEAPEAQEPETNPFAVLAELKRRD